MVILASIFGDDRLFFNQLILLLVLILLVLELLRFVNKTNRELAKFLMSLKHSDFSVNFLKTNAGSSFDELNDAFEQVINAYEKLRIGEEASDKFMEHLINQMPFGILSWQGEDITLMNTTACQFLGIEEMRNWKILKQEVPEFVGHIEGMSGEGSQITDLIIRGEGKSVLLDKSAIKIMEDKNQLLIFRDVKEEMEERELQAWLKLIRILTHEIMNSATPISSLTETTLGMLEENGEQKALEKIDQQNISDIRFSLQTIQRRSENMLNFVSDYRELSKVPLPRIAEVDVPTLVDGVLKLFESQLQEKGFSSSTSNLDFKINCDQGLIEQVLINLISNAIFATENSSNPQIQIIGKEVEGKRVLQVEDNGAGISEKEINDIFIPFFSTREGGSGIGLSLSKQIMYMHGGSITVESKEGEGSTFSLTFKNG